MVTGILGVHPEIDLLFASYFFSLRLFVFFASGDYGAIVGKSPLPQYHVSFGGTQEETQICMPQTKKQLPSQTIQVWFRKLSPDISFWQTWKEVFPWRSTAFPKCLPDCCEFYQPTTFVTSQIRWDFVFAFNGIVFGGNFTEKCLVQLIKLLMIQRSGKAPLEHGHTLTGEPNKIEKKQPSKNSFLQKSSLFCHKLGPQLLFFEGTVFWWNFHCLAHFSPLRLDRNFGLGVASDEWWNLQTTTGVRRESWLVVVEVRDGGWL